MQKWLTIYFILFLSSTANAHLVAAPQDEINKKNSLTACIGLGEACVETAVLCGRTSSMPYTCISRTYFEIEIARELCGKSYAKCFEQNNNYKLRFTNELNASNFDNPNRKSIYESCEKEATYNIKSNTLTTFGKSIYQAFEFEKNIPLYLNQKVFYECVKKRLGH